MIRNYLCVLCLKEVVVNLTVSQILLTVRGTQHEHALTCEGGRTATASRQASRHEIKDAVLLHSWFVTMKLTSSSWFRPVCGGFHNLIRFNYAPFFASCRRHRVLTVACLDACRCAAYLSHALSSFARKPGSWVRIPFRAWMFGVRFSVFVYR
jgi:hypothetical protein